MEKDRHPIKVLHVTPTGHIGGREKQLYELCRQLTVRTSMIHDVLIVHASGPFYEAMRMLRMKVHTVRFKKWRWRYWVEMSSLFQQYDLINFWGIDIGLFLIAMGARCCRMYTLTGTRFIFHRDFGTTEDDTIGVISYLRPVMGKMRREIKRLFFAAFLRGCRHIITPSHFMKHVACEAYRVADDRITVIPNFLDYSTITIRHSRDEVRSMLNVDKGDFLCGIVARYDSRKRLDRFVRAIGMTDPSYSIKGVIIGDGDIRSRKQLDEWIKKSGAESKIALVSTTCDVYDYINSMDTFVLTSKGEAFGLVLLESLYLHVPTVIFEDGGGVHEVIKAGKTGYVVDTVEDLANWLENAAKRLPPDLSEDTRQYVLENFNVNHANDYEKLFYDVWAN